MRQPRRLKPLDFPRDAKPNWNPQIPLERLRRELERVEEFHKKLQGYYEVGLRRKS